jgi:geranylgeranyl diphosphate synthase type I
VRPALCLLACEAAGGDRQTAVPAAAAVELVHAFSLVHDDIQDRDRERHHRPAVWTVWGEAQAINAGDALLALAHLALGELRDGGLSPDSVLQAVRRLDEATLEMVEGQVLDLQMEDREDADVREYLDMVSRKTGALFGCALELGALAATAAPEVQAAFGRLGSALGVAFQMRDDMLGAWGDEAKTGKPAGADILRRKKSLPIVLAFEAAEGDEADRLRGLYEERDVAGVLAAFARLGVRAKCEELAAEKAAEAASTLASLELAQTGRPPAAGAELREAARFLLEREF